MYTELQILEMRFDAYSADIKDGVLGFYEPGYDYEGSSFWDRYSEKPSPEFVEACKLYDKIYKLKNEE